MILRPVNYTQIIPISIATILKAVSLNPPACNPTDSSCTGKCTVQVLPSRPKTYAFTNNCFQGYKTNFIPGTTPRCECILESISACTSLPTSCETSPQCNSNSGCQDYVCEKTASNKPGRCVHGSIFALQRIKTVPMIVPVQAVLAVPN